MQIYDYYKFEEVVLPCLGFTRNQFSSLMGAIKFTKRIKIYRHKYFYVSEIITTIDSILEVPTQRSETKLMSFSNEIVAKITNEVETVDISECANGIEVHHNQIKSLIFHCTFNAPEDFVTLSDIACNFSKDEKKLHDEHLHS